MNYRNSFNDNWLFSLDNIQDSELPTLDDSDWRVLNLPHDWSVEFPFSEQWDGCTAFLPGGLGWYRKSFATPKQLENKSVYIYFDGVSNHSEVYINGHKLGYHPYGYSPFYYKIDEYLYNEDRANVLAVKVDKTRYADSRWYPGAGIYRPVELLVYDKLHFDIWPTYITTPTNNKVNLDVTLTNDYGETKSFKFITDIMDEDDNCVVSKTCEYTIHGDSSSTFTYDVEIKEPKLWHMDAAYMYRAITKIMVEGDKIGENITKFGIRQFVFDTEKGFMLNGRVERLKGVCLHHDAGLVGAAVPIDVWRRRFEVLKDVGCNAIRTAHNPPSEEFLDLCDEMGFFVKHEYFDEWDYPKDMRLNGHEQHPGNYESQSYADFFREWAEIDLKTSTMRDRNHPSIFMWSIGNEIELSYLAVLYTVKTNYEMMYDDELIYDRVLEREHQWSPEVLQQIYSQIPEMPETMYKIGDTAKKLSKWTKEVDTTRPVTANCAIPSVSYIAGFIDALDVVGFSYRNTTYDWAKKNFPDTPIFGAENYPQVHEWQAVEQRDNISGIFLWTGIAYMGESSGNWPIKSSMSSIIDICAFPKPHYYMFKSMWKQDEPTIHLVTQKITDDKEQTKHEKGFRLEGYTIDGNGNVLEAYDNAYKDRRWGWHEVDEHYDYQSGDLIVAEVYTNCEVVELLLNGKSLGVKKLADFPDRIIKWSFNYEEGTLTARSMDGKAIESKATASSPAKIRISSDRDSMEANRYDVAHITAQLYDENDNIVRSENKRVRFIVEGDAKILGVANGSPRNIQDYQSDNLVTHLGRAIMMMQSAGKDSSVKVYAEFDGVKSNTKSIQIGNPTD